MRRWQVIDVNVVGIKCDVPQCGWHDDTVRFADYKSWVNRPCPQCRGNLLTQRDMDLTLKIKGRVRMINFWLGWIGWLFGTGERQVHSRLHMDGRGEAGAYLEKVTHEVEP